MKASRAAAALAVAGAAALAGCSSVDHGATTSSLSAVDIVPPLAGSITTPSGVWATVAMGHLDNPDNTFWQLLHSTDGASAWTDDVGATATATNGGIAIASNGSTLAAAVVPSQLLTYSPVVTTTDGGRDWANSLIAAGLDPHGGSLALGPDGRAAVALDGPTDHPQVQTSASGLTGWRTITTVAGLASTPAGRSCRLAGIDTVAYGPAGPLVGGACGAGGTVGLFRYDGSGGWSSAGVHLGQQFAADPTEVVSIRVGTAGSTTLVAVADHGRTELVPAWQKAGSSSWTTGPTLPAGTTAEPDSVVTGPGLSLLVLQGQPGSTELDSIAGPGSAWESYRTPPTATATVTPVRGAPGEVTALSVNGATLTFWTARSPGSAWTRGQVLQVPIQYGSSG